METLKYRLYKINIDRVFKLTWKIISDHLKMSSCEVSNGRTGKNKQTSLILHLILDYFEATGELPHISPKVFEQPKGILLLRLVAVQPYMTETTEFLHSVVEGDHDLHEIIS